MTNNRKIAILDGPMGTELNRRGSDTTLPLWSARSLIKEPELVKQIHIDYINAGADIITTNTFRTQDRTLLRVKMPGVSGEDLTRLAVELAKEARDSTRKCLIAGSIAPLEDCYSPNLVPSNEILEKEHAKMVNWLANYGTDYFFIETMNTFREAKVAYELTREYPDIPVCVSFTCDPNGNILGLDPWKDVISYFESKVEGILVNCSSLDSSIKALKKLKALYTGKWGVYPNFGEIDYEKGWTPGIVNQKFIEFLNLVFDLQPTFLGTCCGATPKETEKLVEFVSFKTKNLA